MARTGTMFLATLAVLLGIAVQGDAAAPENPTTRPSASAAPAQRPSPHEPSYRRPQVTSIAFSGDGKRLVASYFVYAFNRAGSDWDAWVAQWDLTTGKRLVLPDACGPVAFSPDGETVVMGTYDRSREEKHPWRAQGVLALWKFGEEKPQRLLKMPENYRDVLVSVSFHRGGKCLLALSQSGEILGWGLDKDEPPAVLDRVRVSVVAGASLAFTGWNEVMLAFGPNRQVVVWRFDSDSGTLSDRDVRPAAAWGFGRLGGYPLTAFSSDGYLAAASAGGKVTVGSNRKADLIAQVPVGGGAVAFSPDNKLLAAGDARGIIRIWDIAGGRIVRTLRLDDKPPETVLVAAIQCASKFGDPAANRGKLKDLIGAAARRGAKIIVLPEAAVTGYLTDDIETAWQVGDRALSEGLKGADPKDAAETVPGPSTEFFGKLADQYGVYVTVPLVEVDRRTGNYYNSSVLLGPDGRILLHYRKRDPWPWAEKAWTTPGDRGNPVVDTPFGRLGLLICYDIHKQAEVMGRLKIDTLLYSIAWVDDRDSDWFPEKLPELARSNGFNIVAANWTVPKTPAPQWHGYGQSRIIDASGKVLTKAGDDFGEEIIFAELPLPSAGAVPR